MSTEILRHEIRDESSQVVSCALAGQPASCILRTMQADLGGELGGELEPAPSHDVTMQEERPASPEEQDCNPREATFEQRFEQFYLQLSEGKTGGMVVSTLLYCFSLGCGGVGWVFPYCCDLRCSAVLESRTARVWRGCLQQSRPKNRVDNKCSALPRQAWSSKVPPHVQVHEVVNV